MIAPRLETDRLILRPHRVDDFPAMSAMWGDERVTRFILDAPATPETTWSRLLRYGGHWHMLGFGYWALECRQTGAFLGEAGLADYHRAFQPPEEIGPEAGWVLAAEAHGQGIAVEAMQAALAWSDANLGVSKVTAIFSPDHVASQAVARKLGFVFGRTTRYNGHPTLMMERPRGG